MFRAPCSEHDASPLADAYMAASHVLTVPLRGRMSVSDVFGPLLCVQLVIYLDVDQRRVENEDRAQVRAAPVTGPG